MPKSASGLENLASTVLTGKTSRRGFLARCGAVPVAGVATGGLASSAFAATSTRSYAGKYAIDGHRIVDGYFVWPRKRDQADIVVVVSESGKPTAAAQAIAQRHGASGRIAIVPNLQTSYAGASLLGKGAMVAALMDDLPRLKRMARSSGQVSFVTA
jgi:hypothetical protein